MNYWLIIDSVSYFFALPTGEFLCLTDLQMHYNFSFAGDVANSFHVTLDLVFRCAVACIFFNLFCVLFIFDGHTYDFELIELT